jgi:phosphoadenosine phosphosulfate reductase
VLIQSSRHRREDVAHWARMEEADAAWARTAAHRQRVARALDVLTCFLRAGHCYVGVSWGKDSTALAHLAWRLQPAGLCAPVVWFPGRHVENPDNYLVRDAFLAACPLVDYREVEVFDAELAYSPEGHDGFQAAFERESQAFGRRYVSGIRAEESGRRKLRARRWGESSPNTCAPLSSWGSEDVFAYLHANGLPVHPAYACTLGGRLERGRIRVATLGGRGGTGHGRAEWERAYYSGALREQRLALEREGVSHGRA